jgi:(p)ppGpp synthase/HD superfamily hydrolase
MCKTASKFSTQKWKREVVMSTKESVTTLKGMVRKPAKPVSITMMHKASSGSVDSTRLWSDALAKAIQHAHLAHSQYGNTPDDAVRFHDHLTPYIVHPIWCATTILQEPMLPLSIRQAGSIALLWHDTLEDTTLPLPAETAAEILFLVQGMSFSSFADERQSFKFT